MAEVTSSLDGSLTVISLSEREVANLRALLFEWVGEYPVLEELYDSLSD